MGKSTLEEKIRFQKTFMAFAGAKMTSINPQIVYLSYKPLSNTKMGSEPWKYEGNAGKRERKTSC